MKKEPQKKRVLFGVISILLGLMIILSLIMPSGFWWIVLALALIGAGILLIRSC